MPSPFFSCRIPQEVLSEIEAYLERTGKGKADFLVAAYRLVIENDVLSTDNSNVKTEIQQQMQAAIATLRQELQQQLNDLRTELGKTAA